MSATNTKQLIPDNQADRKLVGIRGWLILPAIGLVVSTLVSSLLAYVGIACVFIGVFIFRRLLLSFLSETMNSGYGVYALSAMVVAVILYLCLCVTCGRFFKKTQSAPRSFIRLLVFGFVASLYLVVLGLVVFGVDDVLILTTLLCVHNPLAWGIAAAIWIPYFKVSARVRATFVKEDNPCLPYKIVLPMRYLIRRRISWLACSAVALCVFIVVVVMTVMAGLVNDFKQKNHRLVGDCVVGTESLVGFAYYEDFVKILQQQEYVAAVSPVIKSFALVRIRGSRQDLGLEIMGVDPVKHSKTTGFGKGLYKNKNDVSRTFEVQNDPNLPGCVLGDLLAQEIENKYLGWSGISQMGFSISCFPLTAKGALAQAGTDLVNTKTFHYSDRSSSGLPRIDGALIYLPFEQVQMLCGMAGPTKRVSWLHIKFEQGINVPAGCEKVRTLWQKYRKEMADQSQVYLLETVSVQSWKEYRRESIAPMENEQTELMIMFGFVAITTVFIILVVFYMIISHKSKDIGILRSIGVSGMGILELFSGFAFLVGLFGSGVGLFTGWLFLLNINRIEDWLFEKCNFQLWDRTIFAIGDIPNKVDIKVLMVIALSAIFVCLVGAFVPSWQAARRKPAETLQVNQL